MASDGQFSGKVALSTGAGIGEVSAVVKARRGFLESTWDVFERNPADVG